ncbi:ABC transporter substrate-binding protein [Komagataeibacter swingsii]|uniref:ABC transporter substrate-binding protein n=2 Tax=Komagataeibacter swingsii TaxID=215220 RepID=A0A2V4R2U7_9PROT|nr:ABC transporter substrate-binding protein [Komagataeibacter swingsii]GBQ65861.1 dipeptide ABC transporter substrate-binding periplasmic protein [Komagataeibacter swingsii DSM 16373]
MLLSSRPAQAADQPAAGKNQVVIGISQEPTVFNPLLPHIEVDDGIYLNLFSPLWSIDDRGRLCPELARVVPTQENGLVSEDGLVWTIPLREDVKWHDGQSFSAEDVMFTFALLKNAEFPAFSRQGYEYMDRVEQTGPYEIRWHMNKPFAPLHSIIASTFIVPRHHFESVEKWSDSHFAEHPVGTGPFQWVQRLSGEKIVLRANPGFYGPRPALDYVTFSYIPDLTVMFTQFQVGAIDYIGMQGIPPNRYHEALQIPGRDIISIPQSFIEGLIFNTARPQFRDQAVRRAIYMALDKESVRKYLYQDILISSESYLPRQSPYFNPDLPAHVFDPTQAARILAEAGWKKGFDGVLHKDGVRLEFTNSTTSGNQLREQTQEVFQENLANIGIRMHIRNMPPAVMWGEYWLMSEFDTALASVDYMLGADPDSASYFNGRNSPALHGAGQNIFEYQNPMLDSILDMGSVVLDTDKRKEIYKKIQEILRQELPMAPLFQIVSIEGKKTGLSGCRPNINVRSTCWNLREWRWV